MTTIFEVSLSQDADFEEIAKQLLASSGTTTVVLTQPQGVRYDWWSKTRTLMNAIASMDSIVHLKFVNVGGAFPRDTNDFNITPELGIFTDLLADVGQRLQSVVFDGGVVTVEEGFPVCEGPMGMEEFEEAIKSMKNCEKFDLMNFQIIYIGNPALGYFYSPVPMSLDSILYTIRQLPKLTPENAAKLTVTPRDVKFANQMNFDRATEDSALDGFCRSYEYENGERR